MSGKGSRNKGNGAEREVAKLIKDWWDPVEKKNFVRTPLSGGWGAPAIRAGFKASGDLMTDAKKFPFSVEVKRREGWNLDRLLSGGKSPVWGWWAQAITQSKEMSCTPMLWIRKNRQPWRIIIPWEQHFFDGPISEHRFQWMMWDVEKLGLEITPMMFVADAFLKLDPKQFVKGKKKS